MRRLSVPGDNPRGCIWPVSTTTAEDREQFFGQNDANRVHVIEADWLERVQSCRLYAYRLPVGTFLPHKISGYWVTGKLMNAIEQGSHQ